MRYLPEYTSVFSASITPTSVTVVGTLVTMQFGSAHGIPDGGLLSVVNSLVENTISSIDDSGDTVVFITTNDHDITEGDTKTVNLTSASTPAVDGDYDILTSENRTTFSIATFPDTGLGDVVLNEPKEYVNINGMYAGITKVSDTELTFNLQSAFTVDPVVKASSVQVNNQIRISGGATVARIIKSYEEQQVQKVWGFVVLGDSDVSKDRNVQDDPVLQQGNQNDWGILLIQEASFFVFVPSKDGSGKVSLDGRAARDLIEDIRPPLYKALMGDAFSTGFANEPNSVLVPTGDTLFKDQTAYIIYQFQFQQVANVNSEDRVVKTADVALRDVSVYYLDVFSDSGNILMESEIDLDENPAP